MERDLKICTFTLSGLSICSYILEPLHMAWAEPVLKSICDKKSFVCAKNSRIHPQVFRFAH